ncbi:MAG: aldo/keto reductase, partial [Planctomycetes bacterium]|nr:aldo/keto reductase [Planctomycetota bacterium]
MNTRKLGKDGPEVFPLALGCMGMSDFYGPADEDESIATIHAALDAGVNLLDTGDFY